MSHLKPEFQSKARGGRAAQAEETLRVLEAGAYSGPAGRIEIGPQVAACVAATRLLGPEDRPGLIARAAGLPDGPEAVLELRNETTLEGAARLAGPAAGVLGVLNFASARNPGGGFLGGSQAQEESLARSSALYASLQSQPAYYEHHRANGDLLYSHRIIVSPGCPVLRTDAGAWLAEPYLVTFLTAPAPNAGALSKNQPQARGHIPGTLRERSEFVLAAAHAAGCDSLVLGAWGCGVFRNDPALVAQIFAELLAPGAPWRRAFRHVLFSVYDVSPDRAIFRAFEQRLPA